MSIAPMMGDLKRTVAPTLLPITMDEAKWAIQTLDDDEINIPLMDKIYEAVDVVERDSHRQLLTQTWQLTRERFPSGDFELHKFPVASVTSVTYMLNGVLTTLSSSTYQTKLTGFPGIIRPKLGYYWPVADSGLLEAVTVTWVAGYASASLLRADYACAKGAVLYALRHLWSGCPLDDNYWAMIYRLRPV